MTVKIMNHLALVTYALHNMSHRQLRSWLTVLGIVIGISAIVLLIALGQGIDASIRNQLAVLGSDYIVVLPGSISMGGGGGFGPPVLKGALTNNDVNALERVPGIDAATGMISQSFAPIRYRGETIQLTVSGLKPSAGEKYMTNGFYAGRNLKDGEATGVIIGYSVAYSLFKKKVEIGSTVNILGKDFKVKGILNKVGAAGQDMDNGVFINLDAMRDILGGTYEKNRVTAILLIKEADADMAQVTKDVEKTLANRHHLKIEDKDFTLISPLSVAESIGQITGMLSLFLGGIAAISLLVGGIGIANAMFTSVLERTREIGVLKSIGASNSAILEIFIIEAALTGALGGSLGIVFALVLGAILIQLGVPIVFTLELLAFAVSFAIIVGVASGLFPARQAAALEPVEALKYE